jgi:hypothetical protein
MGVHSRFDLVYMIAFDPILSFKTETEVRITVREEDSPDVLIHGCPSAPTIPY